MKVEAKALKYGDNINTDIIIPGKYLVITDEEELGRHAMEGIDPDFSGKSRDGIVLVVGENFGSGSSREQAPIALKNANVKCIVAKSFARIFYRNAINLGLPVLECSDLWSEVIEGDILTVSLEDGLIENGRIRRTFKAQPLPPFILDIIQSGGLLNKLKQSLK
ncbi:MAG: 3-isopropylmalate dehydratase small subunit [Nitrososphaerales archaeon]